MKVRSFAALLCAALTASLAHATEPPVREGLVLWLDAAAQRSARAAAALPTVSAQQPVDPERSGRTMAPPL